MHRVTVTLPDDLCATLHRFAQDHSHDNRSDAVRGSAADVTDDAGLMTERKIRPQERVPGPS